jgi:hypothetical protein
MAATNLVTANRDLPSKLVFLTRALKAHTLRDSAARPAERARAEPWSHEEYLAACLHCRVAARDAHCGEGRIRAARFSARKSIEEFDFDHARGLKRDLIAHLGSLDFVTGKENVIFLGPPGLRSGRLRALLHAGWVLCPGSLQRSLGEYSKTELGKVSVDLASV